MTQEVLPSIDNFSEATEQAFKVSYNLSQLAYRAVSEAIHSRRLHGGEVIVEGKLAKALGVSRTPLREALQRLEGEGLVVKVANRSFMVRQVDMAEYMQSLKVREVLEAEAAELAVDKVSMELILAAQHEIRELVASTSYHTGAHWHSDDTVHGLYIKGCGNAVLARLIDSLRVTTRLFELNNLKDRLLSDSHEHMLILEELSARNGKRARKAVQNHVRSLQKFALQSISQ